ncbi:MAG TPA: hypothetical protein VFP12_16205 [Allosphingosinicella sp.]|nr:hypothetical protein [Allosphingosinicella sp.]
MSPILELIAVAFGLLVSLLILANILLVIASLAGRRERALLWLAPIADVAALFLLSDSPSDTADGTPRESGAA